MDGIDEFQLMQTCQRNGLIVLFQPVRRFPRKLLPEIQFDDYTGAERKLHDMFASKRLEGEWFDLNEEDIQTIKSFGKQMPLDGLL